jgi:hypothetical protein
MKHGKAGPLGEGFKVKIPKERWKNMVPAIVAGYHLLKIASRHLVSESLPVPNFLPHLKGVRHALMFIESALEELYVGDKGDGSTSTSPEKEVYEALETHMKSEQYVEDKRDENTSTSPENMKASLDNMKSQDFPENMKSEKVKKILNLDKITGVSYMAVVAMLNEVGGKDWKDNCGLKQVQDPADGKWWWIHPEIESYFKELGPLILKK